MRARRGAAVASLDAIFSVPELSRNADPKHPPRRIEWKSRVGLACPSHVLALPACR
ncbi:hypothetical protein JYU34_002427 [Plutella xylostella]|uniref:Uncharacterized protein n=1 Tax=Plutella xylostella TaxID=51655 RepID=A0ABQ7R270_PLUXY|nr:hypothetical protein JYU34_002427 [Plutella xylostella]